MIVMINKSLLDIADNFDTFFFDAWGVFNIGGKISIPAIDVMKTLVLRGKSVNIMSNTPQTADGMLAGYTRKGLVENIHFTGGFSSGQLCKDALIANKLPIPGKKYYIAWDNTDNPLLGKEYNLFSGTSYQKVADIKDADFVYCDFPTFNGALFSDKKLFEPELSRVISAGKPVICANPDLDGFFATKWVFGPGTPCKIFEQHGLRVVYYGKPYPEIYFDAMQKLGDVNPDRTLMVGDTLHTDILGATRAGIKSCLTLFGGVSEHDLLLDNKKITEENIYAAAKKIGARVDNIIQSVSGIETNLEMLKDIRDGR